jgi:uncharacterized membrane protein
VTRAEFLAALRARLHGAPPSAIDEIVADYAAHFAEGAAAGRAEADIAQALGDPAVLADELRLGLRVSDWETRRSPRSAAQLFTAAFERGIVGGGVLLLMPVLFAALCVLVIASLSLLGGCIWLLIDGLSVGIPGGALTITLAATGCLTGSISMALLSLYVILLSLNWLAARLRVDVNLPSLSRGNSP